MPGALTVTSTGVAALKPAAVALTVVVPPPIGSKATPPVATVVGEEYAPTAIVTVRVCAAPVDVTSCATAALVWLTVTVSARRPDAHRLIVGKLTGAVQDAEIHVERGIRSTTSS